MKRSSALRIIGRNNTYYSFLCLISLAFSNFYLQNLLLITFFTRIRCSSFCYIWSLLIGHTKSILSSEKFDSYHFCEEGRGKWAPFCDGNCNCNCNFSRKLSGRCKSLLRHSHEVGCTKTFWKISWWFWCQAMLLVNSVYFFYLIYLFLYLVLSIWFSHVTLLIRYETRWSRRFFLDIFACVCFVSKRKAVPSILEKKSKKLPGEKKRKKKLKQRILWRIVCCFQSKPMPNTRILNKKITKREKNCHATSNVPHTSHQQAPGHTPSPTTKILQTQQLKITKMIYFPCLSATISVSSPVTFKVCNHE